MLDDFTITPKLKPSTSLQETLRGQGAAAASEILVRAFAAGFEEGRWEEARELATEAAELCWDALHRGHWKNVHYCHREAYGLSRCTAVIAQVMQRPKDANVSELLKELDLAILMSVPPVRQLGNEIIDMLAFKLPPLKKNQQQSGYGSGTSARKRPRAEDDTAASESCPADDGDIPRINCPTLTQFLDKILRPGRPVIITGMMEDWPAMHLWGDNWDYLLRVAGHRTVPVEVGGEYVSEEWGQQLMTLKDFVSDHVEGSGGGYLAQHELLDQIPVLKKDILVPDYTTILLPDEEDDASGSSNCVLEPPRINAWFGPSGTVSTCHTDPFHNLLSQVIGSKAILLFDPQYSPDMYPHPGLMSNTSQIDVLGDVDPGKFPRFASVPRLKCSLKAGEMLYIPPLWWHSVRSLTPSFSVSFWWGKHRKWGAGPSS